eukprot:scaffold199713_cov20-Prasinocladus_malaysianus.AAC.1
MNGYKFVAAGASCLLCLDCANCTDSCIRDHKRRICIYDIDNQDIDRGYHHNQWRKRTNMGKYDVQDTNIYHNIGDIDILYTSADVQWWKH